MPCPIVKILEADNNWLEGQRKNAIKSGKLPYHFDEVYAENERRLLEHRAAMLDCGCHAQNQA